MHFHQKLSDQKLSELYKARGDGTDECVPAWVWEREKAIDIYISFVSLYYQLV